MHAGRWGEWGEEEEEEEDELTHHPPTYSGMLIFGGVVLGVAANVLVARKYGKRVMNWAVPTENKANQYVRRELYKGMGRWVSGWVADRLDGEPVDGQSMYLITHPPTHLIEFWDPAYKRARWEAYFNAAAEEERKQAERLYAWM